MYDPGRYSGLLVDVALRNYILILKFIRGYDVTRVTLMDIGQYRPLKLLMNVLISKRPTWHLLISGYLLYRLSGVNKRVIYITCLFSFPKLDR
jgi:hypothetical protein